MAEVIQKNNALAYGMGKVAAFEIGGSGSEGHTYKKPEDIITGIGNIAYWGENNTYPQEFLKVLKKNGAGGSSYRFLKATHYGMGFKLVRIQQTDKGKEQKLIVPISDLPEIKEFARKSKLKRFWLEIINDLETFNLAFPEFILSKDYSKIVSLRRQPTAKMRYEKINPKTGMIENAYFCHDWSKVKSDADEYVEKIPVIDSYFFAEQIKEYCKMKKIHKFMMPIFYPLTDETYYPEPDHHSVYKNGWMDVVNSIPEYKKSFSANQLNVKYMVYISDEYFKRTYGRDWDQFEINKKQEIRKHLANSIDDHLAGNKNAGKSIQATVFKDQQGKWVKGIEVVPLKDENNGEGKGLLDAGTGNQEIMSAIGTDPNLMGAGIPGSKLGGGGGSNKREALNILNALFKSKRETSLEVWQILRDYNGWPDDLEGHFAVSTMTTLDKNPTGQQQEI